MILYDKLEKETGKDYAYRVIKDNIMSLELKPGEVLSESDLAQKLNVSRTPIREVLIKLKSEKLIEVKPQTGTYVSLIDWNLIDQAVFMRYNLEKKVLEEAATNLNEDALIEMEKCLFAQKLIKDKQNNSIEFHYLDNKFHKLLFEGTGKSGIWDAIANISTHYNRMRLLADIKKDKIYLIDEHMQYLNIIKRKNEDKVLIEEIAKKHIIEPSIEWVKLVEENEEIRSYIKNM